MVALDIIPEKVEAKKNERANALKEVKRLCKEDGACCTKLHLNNFKKYLMGSHILGSCTNTKATII